MQRDTGPASGSAGKTSSAGKTTQTRTDQLADVDIDKLADLVSRRLRAEFRIDRERFGRLRDSTR